MSSRDLPFVSGRENVKKMMATKLQAAYRYHVPNFRACSR